MKRKFTFLAALALLVTLAIPMGVWGQTTETLNIESYASANNWENSTQYLTATVGNVTFTATGGSNTGKYYTSGQNWRFYQNENPTLTISVPSGNTITSVTPTFSVSNTGTLLYGTAVLTSEEAVSVSGASVTFNVGNSGTATNGQVRFTNIDVTYTASGTQPTTYTVSFDAGDGTFVGNNDFPNATNTKEAGTYILPSAERSGYAFDGWLLTGNTTPLTGNYTVSGDVAFTAAYTENTTPGPIGDLVIDFESTASTYTDWTFTNLRSQQTNAITAHGGTYYGTNTNDSGNGVATASIQTTQKIATPQILTCYVSKQSTNTSASTWYIQVSSDGSSWTDVASRSASDMSKGEWKEFTANLSSYTNVYVRVYYSGSTAIRNIDDLTLTTTAATVATPTFNPANGTTFGDEGLSVEISCATENTTIYYTLDGSDPDNESTAYAGAISLTETTTIKAIAFDGDDNTSAVATATYTYVDPNQPGTQANPYTVAQARAAIDAGTGTQGVYATGIVSAIPTAYNSTYGNVTFNMVDEEGDEIFLQAYRCASGTGVDASEVAVGDIVVVYGNLTFHTASSTYEFAQGCQLVSLTHPVVAVEAPVFGLAEGGYAEAQTITLTCATEGATIYYTTDGTTPDNNSTTYSDGITVSQTTTIKAIAYNNGNNSTVSTATYYILSNDNTLTVTDALGFDTYPVNNIFVQGIVSTAPTQDPTNNGELTYYISVDGEATDQLQVYKGKGLNNTAFEAQDDIQLGDIVTIFGNVKIYNGQKEFEQGNYLVSFERPQITEPTIIIAEDNVSVPTEGGNGTITVTYENIEPTDINPVAVFYAEDGETSASYDWITVEFDSDNNAVYTVTANSGEARTAYFKVHEQNNDIYSNLVTISQEAYVIPGEEEQYELFTGDLVEGDYLIVYDGGAMNNTVTSDRLQYEAVTIADNVITTDNAAIVWHIAPSEDYWTIYSADANAYAASTGAKNKAQMLANGTDDMALWTVSGAETYEFVNKKNTENGVNANLRKNGTYGFACYATGTGGALSLYKKVESPVTETYTLEITGYSNFPNPDGGYYLIASPVTVNPADVEGMTEGSFDLYYFDEAEDNNEWQNWKDNDETGHFNLVPGTGYLYAHQEGGEFELTGTPYTGDGTITLKKTNGTSWSGWNLVGNPFGETAYIQDGEWDFYVMNQDGLDLEPAEVTSIGRMQGIFVVANSDGEQLTLTTEAPTAPQGGKIVVNVRSSRGNNIDRAMIRFGEGRQLPKFQLNPDNTKLYIAQEGEDFAVVRSIDENSTPVSFRAAENGIYTLSVNADNIEMEYLHLIDNMTGNDIDLLATPSYTFEARTTDYADRFNLVYATCDDVNENNMQPFAFFNGSEWVINNAGNALLQVVDVTGRVISSETLNGNAHISLDQVPGVYVMRLVSGNNVKVQKVIIK